MSSKASNFTEPPFLHLYNGYNNDNDFTDLTWVLGRSAEILCVIVYDVHLYTNMRPGDFHSFLVLDPEGKLSGGQARPTQCKDLGAPLMDSEAVAKNNNTREVGVHAQVSPRIVCV